LTFVIGDEYIKELWADPVIEAIAKNDRTILDELLKEREGLECY
jgi:hypothetical protein